MDLSNGNCNHIKKSKAKDMTFNIVFLDVPISQNKESFTTKVCHKPAFSGVYSNFNSFIADEYKHGLIFTLLFWIFSIVLDFSKFHEDVNYLKVVLKKNYFPANLVDKIPLCLRCHIVCKFLCGRCNARVGEHSGISPLSKKRSKSKKSTAVKDHMLICGQPVSFADYKVLASSSSELHLKIKKSLLILRDQPFLNKNEASLP